MLRPERPLWTQGSFFIEEEPTLMAVKVVHVSDISGKEAEEVAVIEDNVKKKFRAGGTWQNRWPTHVQVYESEWARFKAA